MVGRLRARAGRVRAKAAVFVLAAASLLAAAGACGGKAEPAPGPRLVLADHSFDLGTILVGQSVERSVEFANGGDAPLQVSIAKIRPAPDADCGCGIEGSRVEPEWVPAGGKGRLVFTLRAPPGMENTRDRMLVQLESNDLSEPEHTIDIIFNMIPAEGQ